MSGFSSIVLAYKYLKGHFRRFIFLFFALGFGFAIITVMTSLSEGMSASVYRASQNHYGGHLFVLGFDKQAGTMGVVERDADIQEAVAASGLHPLRMVRRTNVFRDGVLYFNGTAVRQKNVLGIDWEAEREDFLGLDYASPIEGEPEDGDWIFISEPVAEELGARIGDDVLLEVRTRKGQKNTGVFVVRGIIRDSSIFGYFKCFVDRRRLNELLQFRPDEYSSLGLYFSDLRGLTEKTDRLYAELAKRLPMGPPIREKNELTFQLDQKWQGVRYFTIPLHVYVSQVSDLLTAIRLISYFLYVVIMLIVLVSVFVTYRLILHERSRELGTMRAIGIGTGNVRWILLLESFFLFLISVAFGFLLALVAGFCVSFLSFTSIPGFEIFLTRGRLAALYSPKTIIMNILILLGVTIPGVVIPAFQVVRPPIPQVLSGGDA